MKLAIHGRGLDSDRIPDIVNLIGFAYKRGATILYSEPLLHEIEGQGIDHPAGDVFDLSQPLSRPRCDLLLVLGGDGTFLSSLGIVQDSGIPVVGINYGRLGFLTAAEAGAGESLLEEVLDGKYTVVGRPVLSVRGLSQPLPADFYPYALNEIAVSGLHQGLVGVTVSIDGRKLPEFWADGLLIATQTGSTAYSLSLGGPIVLPGADVMVVSPIAPHNLNVRPMVVPLSAAIDIQVTPVRGGITVSADNHAAELLPGSSFRVQRAPFDLQCINLTDNSFINALRTKLHWGEDFRNANEA